MLYCENSNYLCRDSSSFEVTNGVRQGGILSPKLFIVYLDDLSDQLNNSVFCPGFQKGRVPSEKGTLAR